MISQCCLPRLLMRQICICMAGRYSCDCTSANSSPARFVFIRTAEGKAKLKEALSGSDEAQFSFQADDVVIEKAVAV